MLRGDPESSCASHLYWLSCPHPDPSRRISANYCLNRGNFSLSRLTWAHCDIHSQFSNLWKPPLEVLDTGLSHVLWGISGITGCCRVALQTDTVEVSWTVKSTKVNFNSQSEKKKRRQKLETTGTLDVWVPSWKVLLQLEVKRWLFQHYVKSIQTRSWASDFHGENSVLDGKHKTKNTIYEESNLSFSSWAFYH